jgi:hypothetical protein
MEPTEQGPIGADTVAQHRVSRRSSPGSARGQAFAPATLNRSRKRSSCLGLIACTTKAAVNQRVDHRSMRDFDRDQNRACLSGNRQQPIAELRQTRTAVRKFPFADDAARSIEQTRMVASRTPNRRRQANSEFLVSLRFLQLMTHASLSRRLPIPIRHSTALLPTRHPSWPARRGTRPTVCFTRGVSLVAPAGRPA